METYISIVFEDNHLHFSIILIIRKKCYNFKDFAVLDNYITYLYITYMCLFLLSK